VVFNRSYGSHNVAHYRNLGAGIVILPGFPVAQQVQLATLGLIPVGGIIGFPTNSPPSGWENWAPTTDRALRGVGPSTTAGATGGSTTVTLTGTTDGAANHNGTTFQAYGTPFAFVQTPITAGYSIEAVATADAGAHAHTISNTSFTFTPPYVRLPLIKKTGTDGPVPQNGFVFGASITPIADLSNITTYIGRVLQVASALATGGTTLPISGSINTGSAGDHIHGVETQLQTVGSAFGPASYTPAISGAHTHSLTAQITAVNFKRTTAAMYQALGNTGVPRGTIIAYEGPDTYNPDWKPCNGSGGTVDIRDALLLLSDEAGAGVTSGDGTVTWNASSVSTAGSHNHQGANQGTNHTQYTQSHSSNEGDHTHTVPTRSGSCTPVFVGVKFLQYLP